MAKRLRSGDCTCRGVVSLTSSLNFRGRFHAAVPLGYSGYLAPTYMRQNPVCWHIKPELKDRPLLKSRLRSVWRKQCHTDEGTSLLVFLLLVQTPDSSPDEAHSVEFLTWILFPGLIVRILKSVLCGDQRVKVDAKNRQLTYCASHLTEVPLAHPCLSHPYYLYRQERVNWQSLL